MMDVTPIEKQLLYDLNDRDLFEGDEYLMDFSNYILKEKDPIKRIQEMVYYLERLEGYGFVSLEEDFYKESDKISFEYMNSATEVDFDKVHITSSGKSWLEEHRLSWFEKRKHQTKVVVDQFFLNKRFVIIGYVVIFVLGIITGKFLC